MTIINPKSIAGVTSITTPSGSDNLFTVHTNNTTERVRINNDGDVIVGSGITVSPDGDIFATGVCTATTFSGSLAASNLTGALPAISGANLTNLDASDLASGTVPTARLGSGTASSSTFLRGDSTFQTISTDLVDDTTPQLGGNLDNNGKNITFGDSAGSSDDRLTFGAGTDLSIYHDSSNSRSRIEHSTDNALEILQGGNAGMLIQNQNSYNIEIKTNAEDAIKCVANGAVELYHDNTKQCETSANGLSFPSGKGIDFSATSNSSGTMSSELFDDYEEGSWTPTFEGTTTTGTVTYQARNGKYVKIGKLVAWEMYIAYNNGNGAGYVHITGLPFTSASNSTYPSVNIGYVHNYTLRSDHILTGLHANNDNYLYFYERPNGGGSNVQINYDGSGSWILSGHYEAS